MAVLYLDSYGYEKTYIIVKEQITDRIHKTMHIRKIKEEAQYLRNLRKRIQPNLIILPNN